MTAPAHRFRSNTSYRTAGVAAFAARGGQEDFDDLADLVFGEQVGAEAQDVAMIVFAGAVGGDLIVNQAGADVVHFVGGNGHTDAASVEEDADRSGAYTCGDGLVEAGIAKSGVVHGGRCFRNRNPAPRGPSFFKSGISFFLAS